MPTHCDEADPKVRAMCSSACVKAEGAEPRALLRTPDDVGAESRARPLP